MSSGGDRLSPVESAEFAGQLAGLSGAGLALPGGLRALGQEMSAGPLRRMLAEVADDLEAGEPLEEALRDRGDRFPPHLAGIVAAASRSGRVAEVLTEAVRGERLGLDLRRRVLVGLAYPLLLIGMFLALYVLLSVLVVAQFEEIYRDFGIDLPLITMALIRTSHFLAGAWPGLLLIAFGLPMLAWLADRWIGPGRRHRISGGAPLLGPLARSVAMFEFSQLLARLLECRVPLPEALALAGEGVRDVDLARTCRWIGERVAAGRPLADAALDSRAFPRGFHRLLAWAEKNQSLPEALRMAASIFEGRARSQTTLVSVFAFVAAVVLVLFGVMFLVMGLFLPMIKLISELSG